MTPRTPHTLSLPGGRTLAMGARTLVMGIVNVTPDSFADGGEFLDPAHAAERAMALDDAGADLLDIGGESTRPGAEPVPVQEEMRRVLPVLDRLAGRVRAPISVDTYKVEVAEAALDHGAAMINDVSGLASGTVLASVAAAAGAPLVLMHNRGGSREMYRHARYRDVGREVAAELGALVDRAVSAGLPREQIVVDPGLGFAKRADATWAALAALPSLRCLDRPILVGPSRKSFLTAALGKRPPGDREWGTAAAVAAAVWLGAHIVRAHRVDAHGDVIRVADAIRMAALTAAGDHSERAAPHAPRQEN
ncbi:MAG: dihydropteroate synthase [Acidobacteria bacterium]|nr:dihydropteroate synthase [Acidobacteriota bacterium]